MKRQFLSSGAILGFLVILVAASAGAQVPATVDVKIPFDFSAGKATLKAGEYSIKRAATNTLQIRSVDGKTTVLISAPLTISSRDFKAGERLVFNQYGDRYFLSQVWLSAETGRQLFTSAAETKAARDYRLANGPAKAERIEIALRPR